MVLRIILLDFQYFCLYFESGYIYGKCYGWVRYFTGNGKTRMCLRDRLERVRSVLWRRDDNTIDTIVMMFRKRITHGPEMIVYHHVKMVGRDGLALVTYGN